MGGTRNYSRRANRKSTRSMEKANKLRNNGFVRLLMIEAKKKK
jgi:hypothetical protein